MNKLLTPGESQPLDFCTADGRLALQIRIDRHDEGVSIVVTQPTGTTLNRTFTNDRLAEGRAYVALIRDMARAGRPVCDIEQAAGTFTTAAAIVNEAAQDLPAPVSLAAYATTARRDFSKGRVHRQNPTPAELDLIRHAVDNGDGTFTVRTRPGQTWLVLKALHARIGGVKTIRPATASVVDALTYTAEQLAPYLTSEEYAA